MLDEAALTDSDAELEDGFRAGDGKIALQPGAAIDSDDDFDEQVGSDCCAVVGMLDQLLEEKIQHSIIYSTAAQHVCDVQPVCQRRWQLGSIRLC